MVGFGSSEYALSFLLLLLIISVFIFSDPDFNKDDDTDAAHVIVAK